MSVLPLSWRPTALSEICYRIVDGSHNPPKSVELGRPMLSARNVINHQILFEGFRYISDEDFATEDARTQIKPGDVLLTIVGTIGRTAVVSEQVEPFALQRSVAVLKPIEIDGRYLAYALNEPSQQQWLVDNAKGTAQKGVYLKTLGTAKIPIAPLAEQTRIVEKLEELLSDLDAGVAELKAAQRKLAQYRHSLLKAAVEGALTADWRAARHDSEKPPRSSSRRKPGSSALSGATTLDSRFRGNDGQEEAVSRTETGANLLQRILTERRTRWETQQLTKFAEQGKTPPKDWKAKYPEPVAPETTNLPKLTKGWVWVSVDHLLVDGPQNGLYLPASRYGRGSPILRIDDFQSDWIRSIDKLKLVETDEETFSIYALHEGDLVVNRVNSITHLGKSHIVRREHDGVLFESNMMRARLNSLVDATFVGLYLSSEIGRARLIKDAKWAVNQASINQQDVKRTPVPLPGLSEQLEICELVVAQLQEMASMQSATDVSLKQSAAQRKNILKAAFAGQLVPQDPNDEPASALLERIRAERASSGTMGGKRGRNTARIVTKEAR